MYTFSLVANQHLYHQVPHIYAMIGDAKWLDGVNKWSIILYLCLICAISVWPTMILCLFCTSAPQWWDDVSQGDKGDHLLTFFRDHLFHWSHLIGVHQHALSTRSYDRTSDLSLGESLCRTPFRDQFARINKWRRAREIATSVVSAVPKLEVFNVNFVWFQVQLLL